MALAVTILVLVAGCRLLLAVPVGFRIYIVDAPQRSACGDSDDLVVIALGNHRFSLNEIGLLDANG